MAQSSAARKTDATTRSQAEKWEGEDNRHSRRRRSLSALRRADGDTRAQHRRRQAIAPAGLLQAMVLLHEQELQDHAGHAATVQGDQLHCAERPWVRHYDRPARASRPERTSTLGVTCIRLRPTGSWR